MSIETFVICPASQAREVHDWRLWKRDPRHDYRPPDLPEGEAWGKWPLVGHVEVWYCTRCRKLEERTVMLDGS